MNSETEALDELTKRATSVLIREVGVVDTLRFLNQFRAGAGDYTEERRKLFAGKSVVDIAAEIRKQRDSNGDR